MNEKNPFEKYDKLFEEQDQDHDNQVSKYRNEKPVKRNSSFQELEKTEQEKRDQNKAQSKQGTLFIIFIVASIVIFRMVSNNEVIFTNRLVPILIFIVVVNLVSKYFKNKR
ncbi:MAG: hypothetical protein Q7I99_07875 [Acholeplasmataceae bacterium]|nr:hypothetical protein [Acholeplasmataceae bacterium]